MAVGGNVAAWYTENKGSEVRGATKKSTTHQAKESSKFSKALLPIKARRHPIVKSIETALLSLYGLGFHATATEKIPIIVGLSGGVDSTALLLAMTVIRDRAKRKASLGGGIELIAVHVHHHLRASADDDAQHVQKLCKVLGVQCYVEDVWPGKERGNLLERARHLRMNSLSNRAKLCGARYVVTGHHAEDQLETMIMMLCRGAGLDGLSGIPMRRQLAEGVWVLRPMLSILKSECMEFCTTAGIAWREDESNKNVKRTRAALRANVLKSLDQLWPGAAVRASACAAIVGEARDLLKREVERVFRGSTTPWPRESLRKAGELVVAAGLRQLALRLSNGRGADALSYRVIQPVAAAVCDEIQKPRRFCLSTGVEILVTSKSVQLTVCAKKLGRTKVMDSEAML